MRVVSTTENAHARRANQQPSSNAVNHTAVPEIADRPTTELNREELHNVVSRIDGRIAEELTVSKQATRGNALSTDAARGARAESADETA